MVAPQGDFGDIRDIGDIEVSARQALWTRLQESALVEGDAPPPDPHEAPWFVRAMLGIAGWLGALFLLGFVGTLFSTVFESSTAAILVGSALCAAMVALFRLFPRGGFVAQFGLAVSLAGQILILMGLLDIDSFERSSISWIAIWMALVQSILFFLIPNFVHRVWTAWTATLALVIALDGWGLESFSPALATLALTALWLAEFDHPRQGSMIRAAGYGLTLTTLITALVRGHFGIAEMVVENEAPLGGEMAVRIAGLLTGMVLVWTVARLLRREGVAWDSGAGRIGLASAAIVALASLEVPGLAPPIVVLILGFANGNRTLTGLGILSLLAYLSYYYYSLEATLLQKSGLLILLGVSLLLARLALHRWWPEHA